ncbi:MAG: ABC transporter permease [Candidatus Aminicenantaceae bacterium]
MKIDRDLSHPPGFGEWLLKRLFPDGGSQASAGDFAEIYGEILHRRGRAAAWAWYWSQILLSFKALIVGKTYWSAVMFKKNLIIALRNFKRQKGYTVINMFGLTAGIASCLVIFLFVTHEMGYDSFRSDRDRIFRIAVRSEGAPVEIGSATICAPVAQVLKDNFPEVEAVGRILPVDGGLVGRGEVSFYEDSCWFADAELFEILSIPFIEGQPGGSLDRPRTVVISRKMAEKYFGNAPALGQILLISQRDYEVTGVVEDAPVNSHLKYDYFVPLKQLEGRYPFEEWFLANLYVYTKLRSGIDMAKFSGRVANIVEDYVPEERLEQGDEKITYFLQPMAGIHLQPQLRSEMKPGLNPTYLYVFSAVGVLILLIACINFINLSTARSLKRARDVGVRKVIGARRDQLSLQFLGESLLIVLAALICALLLVWTVLPGLMGLTGIAFSASALARADVVIFLVLLVGLAAFAAGGYPALFLSSFQPVRVLKHDLRLGNRGGGLRKGLVVGQFAVSIALIAGTLGIFRQIDYMKNQSLGLDQTQKLVLPVRERVALDKNYETVKAAFRQGTGVLGATVLSDVPGQQTNRWTTEVVIEGEKRSQDLNYLYVDPDFRETFQIRMEAGRFFSAEMSTDLEQAFVLNLAAVRAYGLSTAEEALGVELETWFKGTVIGVIDDFHYRGLQSTIEPLALVWRPGMFDHIVLDVDTSNLSAVLASVEASWDRLYPVHPYEFYFLDASFNRQYLSEERLGRMLSVFTALGIVIACLGLFGLASFTVEQRTKEIGIRKVLGASGVEIMVLLTKEFAKWVLVANLIAWPLTYFALGRWLRSFAYRAPLGVETYLAAAGAALAVALITISYQAIKAASADPVGALKYE